MIAIIDYGSGNVGAIANVYKQLKVPHLVTGKLDEMASADRYVLPGVGAFDTTISYLRRTGMIELLEEQVLGKRKLVLGVCVGMQILAESSEEGLLEGLGWIPGRVRKIDESTLSKCPKLPHMGWNSVELSARSDLFDTVDCTRGFYFLHSYFFDSSHEADITATVTYGKRLPCAVARGNVYGVQFHPEKSHSNGVAVFRNFAGLRAC